MHSRRFCQDFARQGKKCSARPQRCKQAKINMQADGKKWSHYTRQNTSRHDWYMIRMTSVLVTFSYFSQLQILHWQTYKICLSGPNQYPIKIIDYLKACWIAGRPPASKRKKNLMHNLSVGKIYGRLGDKTYCLPLESHL